MAKENRQKYLSSEETAMFCEQIALILKSGMPLHDGVEALCENYADSKYAHQFKQLDQKMKETGSLGEALDVVGFFPPYMVNSIRIAERAGTADTVCESLALYYTREGQTNRAIKNAVTYPLMLILMMAVVIVVLVVNVLPIFTEVFKNLGTEMSATSLAIMNFGLTAGRVVLVLVALVMAIAVILFILFRTKMKNRVMRLISKLFPPIRDIRKKTTAVRFASVMSMMMASGFPLEEAINMIPDLLNDEDEREKVRECCKRMENGETFPKAVEACDIFDSIHVKMIRMGYMAGQTDTVMNRLTDIYEESIDDSIRRMVGMIEPTLVAVLSVIIGAVLLSVMLPLMSILSSL